MMALVIAKVLERGPITATRLDCIRGQALARYRPRALDKPL